MGGRGRPPLRIPVEVLVWVLVELKRDRVPSSSQPRLSVRAAADNLAKVISGEGDRKIPAHSLRRIHKQAEKKMREGLTPTQFDEYRETMLREVRRRRLEHGWDSDLRELIDTDLRRMGVARH